MNRINIFATMGFTGIAVSMTLLVSSENPGTKFWAMVLGIFSLVMVYSALSISGKADRKEMAIKLHEIKASETMISELKDINTNISELINEIRQDRNERKDRESKQ